MTKNELMKAIITQLEEERKAVSEPKKGGVSSEFETLLHCFFLGKEKGLEEALAIVKKASKKDEKETLNSLKPQGKFTFADLKRGMSLLAMKISMLVCDVACLQSQAEETCPGAFDQEANQLKVLSDLLDNAQEYLDTRCEYLSFENINPDEVEEEFSAIIRKETK